MSAAHNTVVVDGQDHGLAKAEGTLLAASARFRAFRASGAALVDGLQYERTVVLVQISDQDAYLVDVFRVVGGKTHEKFFHSHFGTVSVEGLALQAADAYGRGTVMRAFRRDPRPQPGWTVDWQIEDRYGRLPPGADVHLAYTDLTAGAEAWTAEGWVSLGERWTTEEAWIPRLLVRRWAPKPPLASTFVAVIEPYSGHRNIAAIRRLHLETPRGERYPDAHVALEIQLADGRRDLVVALDGENPLCLWPAWRQGDAVVQPRWNVRLQHELCWLRRDRHGARQEGWPVD
jgi:hypothetical protein